MLARRRLARGAAHDLARDRPRCSPSRVIARWLDLGGAGQTWDEDVNWAAGRNYVTNVLALDFSRARRGSGTTSTRR